MAVTTSVFPNMNTFSHGPEFCVLYRKLRSTCQSHKRPVLVERYETICSEIEAKPEEYCPKNFTRDFGKIPYYLHSVLKKSGKKCQKFVRNHFLQKKSAI